MIALIDAPYLTILALIDAHAIHHAIVRHLRFSGLPNWHHVSGLPNWPGLPNWHHVCAFAATPASSAPHLMCGFPTITPIISIPCL